MRVLADAAGWVALAVTRQGSHGSGRACINASGSSADRLALPERVPATIRASYVDRVRNLDVLHLFPSLGSAGRRFASLPRVLRGEFPCFSGTIEALRLPAARPAALRRLRLAVPQRSLVLFAPRRTSAPPKPGVGNPVTPAGMSLRRRQDLPSSWGTPIVRLRMFPTDAGRTAGTRPVRCRGVALGHRTAKAPARGLSALHSMASGLAVYASPDGLPRLGAKLASSRWSGATGRGFHPQGPNRRFQSVFVMSSSFSKLAWRNRCVLRA